MDTTETPTPTQMPDPAPQTVDVDTLVLPALDLRIPNEAKEAFWRILGDRSIDGQMVGVISEWSMIAYRLVVAAELERLAEPLRAQIARQHDRIVRLSKADGSLLQSESAIAAEQELKGFVGMLDRRTAELRDTPAKEDGNA